MARSNADGPSAAARRVRGTVPLEAVSRSFTDFNGGTIGMVHKSKWVDVPAPDVPVAAVARAALHDRLYLVWHYLRRSARGAVGDTGNVHQLRVSTRRAVAALRIFKDLLPPRRQRRILKRLKRIRRAAGAARDLDVMLARFRSHAQRDPADEHWTALIAALRARRIEAQQPIDQMYRKLRRWNYLREVRSLCRRIRLRTDDDRAQRPTFRQIAHRFLHAAAGEFLQHAEADLRDHVELHAFRIRGKQLRYSLEIFAGAFGPALREQLYPRIAELQERLGRINDHATASERLREWLEADTFAPPLRSTLATLQAEEVAALETSSQEFLDWWSPGCRKNLRGLFYEALEMPAPAAAPADAE